MSNRTIWRCLAAAVWALSAVAPLRAGTADDIERAVSHDPRAVATQAQAALAAARAKQDAPGTLLALRQIIRVRVDIDETAGTRELIAQALALAEKQKDPDATAELLLGDAMLSHVLNEGAETDARLRHQEYVELAALAMPEVALAAEEDFADTIERQLARESAWLRKTGFLSNAESIPSIGAVLKQHALTPLRTE